MTTPYERTRAVMATRRFLEELSAGDDNEDVRRSAQHLLRHYPDAYHIDIAALAWPMAWAPASSQHAQAPSYLELLARLNNRALDE